MLGFTLFRLHYLPLFPLVKLPVVAVLHHQLGQLQLLPQVQVLSLLQLLLQVQVPSAQLPPGSSTKSTPATTPGSSVTTGKTSTDWITSFTTHTAHTTTVITVTDCDPIAVHQTLLPQGLLL